MNIQKPFSLIVGDIGSPIGRTLYNGRSPANLTGLTVQFYMISKDGGTPIVNWAAATVVSAAAGTVYYAFQAADVDTAGLYYGYFRAGTSPSWKTYPAEHRGIPIVIHALSTDENH